MEKLTEKQKRFVDFYIQTGNASEAARLAGYKGKNLNRIGTENLSNLVIKNAIDARLKEFESNRKADAKEILEYMTSVMRGELEEDVVSAVGTGDLQILRFFCRKIFFRSKPIFFANITLKVTRKIFSVL